MHKNILTVVGITILFLGISIQPAIALEDKSPSNTSTIISKNENTNNLQFTTTIKIYKPNGIKTYTLKMTKKQRDEFDIFVDAFKKELEKAETLEETIMVYNDAIIKLDKIGLIPKGISIEELQQLITGNKKLKLLNHWKQANQIPKESDTFENIFCLISGKSTNTGPCYLTLSGLLSMIINVFMNVWFGLDIGLGQMHYGTYLDTKTLDASYPADGWIHTLGLQGKWKYEGTFYGQLKTVNFQLMNYYFIGTKAFRGIFFSNDYNYRDDFYIGRTMKVKIGSKRPDF